jgi:LysR family transcriptional regulator, transcriptional activator of the cysJI operon
MEDHRLRAFCLVVEMKSFSRAAKAKFLTQSAMSHLIKNLEEELGAQLLIRSGTSVVPTPAGKVLYGRALRILEEYGKLGQDISSFLDTAKSSLAIGATATAASYLLPQVLYAFTKSYPEVKVSVSVLSAQGIVRELQDTTIDTGIGEVTMNSPAFSSSVIAEDEVVVIASDGNPLTKKTSLSPGDLLSQPFIMPDDDSGIRECINEFFSEAGIDMKKIVCSMTSGSLDLIVQMVRAGRGISFVSKWAVFDSLKEGTIAVLEVKGKRLYRTFNLLTLRKGPSDTSAKTFLQFLKTFRLFTPF